MLEKILEEIDKRIDIQLKNVAGINDEVYRYGYVKSIEAYQQAKLIVQEILSKHMNDGWISVEERLPEDQKKVLVSDTEGKVRLIEFSKFLFEHPQYTHGVKVIAWRPIPDPYRPGKGEEEWRD